MNRFILFLKKIIFVLLFVVIEAVALNHYAKSSSYSQAKVMSLSNAVFGDIHRGIANVRQYFHLASENRRLSEEIARLRAAGGTYRPDSVHSAEFSDPMPYRYMTARVVNNSIARSENYMTLDKGSRDGVVPDMAVIRNGAIAGYVLDVSDKFSIAISVLNTRFKTSGKIQGEPYSGTISWNGERYDEVTISEIPKYATMNVGDTIVTTEFSSIFPPEVLIGTIRDFELVNGTYYDARIRLFADMGALDHVILVEYLDLPEKRELEESVR